MLDTALQLLGRAHPLLLHLPIGILSALIALELLALLRLLDLPPRIRAALAIFLLLATAASIATGLLLEREPAYASAAGDTLFFHKWLGIALGILTALAALSLISPRTRKLYPLFLLLALTAMFPAGHLGATMTHGEGFLTEPLRAAAAPLLPTPSASRGVYSAQIAPILSRYCISCHGDSKQQGKLALHTPDAILAGGSTGSAIEPGEPDNSELLVRLHLPVADRDHMPPKLKPQPSAADISLLERWIAAGAPFEGGDLLPADPDPDPDSASPPDSPPPVPTPAPTAGAAPSIPTAALSALRAHLAHAELIDPATSALWVSFDGAASLDDPTAANLLAPLAPYITDLSLAGTRPGPNTIAQLARMPALHRLSLARTPCSPDNLSAIAALPNLHELNLTSTALNDSAAASLTAGFPALTLIFIWNSGLSPKAIADLRAARPALTILADESAPAPLETEPELKFTSDAPPPAPATPPAVPHP